MVGDGILQRGDGIVFFFVVVLIIYTYLRTISIYMYLYAIVSTHGAGYRHFYIHRNTVNSL